MKGPGFVGSLTRELQEVDDRFKRRVDRRGGLSNEELVSLTTRMDADPALYYPDHPQTKDVVEWSDITSDDEVTGDRAIKDGEVAFVVLAGGAGTRAGGPKLFMRLPEVGLSLLGWKLLQAGEMPFWAMTSPDMMQEIQRHISSLALPLGMRGHVFEQFEGYRLTPDNRLSVVNGMPELYPLGHGDVGPALVESGVLDDNPNVKQVYVCNVDNVMASPHPGIIGFHRRVGRKVTCEVVERMKGDKGGVIALVNEQLQIAEDFRLPPGFADASTCHNTNTMIIDIDVLRWEIPWRWHRVRKHVDNRLVVQYERLLQQYTEECSTNFVKVPREARYCPIKTTEDLDRAGKLVAGYRFQ